MNRRPALGMAVLGSGLIAVTYGLARFAFGLFLPSIREDMAITPELAGLIGSIPFASFVVAILLGPALVRAVGAKLGGVTAITLALLGLGAIATAPAPWMLAVGVAVCGVATGLSTPALAAAVHRVVPKAKRGRVNAAVNAGTSIGVALCGPAVLLLAEAWRPAYLGFAGLAGVGVLAAAIFLPASARPAPDAHLAGGPSRQQWADMTRLSTLAAATGFVSALYWVFAPDFAVQAGGLAARESALMWLAVGLGGLAGGAAGDLIAKHGPASSHAFATAAMAAALTLLAADPGQLDPGAVLRRQLRRGLHDADRHLPGGRHGDHAEPARARLGDAVPGGRRRAGRRLLGERLDDRGGRAQHRLRQLRRVRPGRGADLAVADPRGPDRQQRRHRRRRRPGRDRPAGLAGPHPDPPRPRARFRVAPCAPVGVGWCAPHKPAPAGAFFWMPAAAPPPTGGADAR
ncbi:MAG: MFS transporter [Rhodovibrio sp.]|nr:MFS transporter [Rhodovibrio sp.]